MILNIINQSINAINLLFFKGNYLDTVSLDFYECKIDGCMETIFTNFYDFIQHLTKHIEKKIAHHYSNRLDDNVTFPCPWLSCYGYCTVKNLSFHIFFHAHSVHLQNKGRKFLDQTQSKDTTLVLKCPNARQVINKYLDQVSFGNRCLWQIEDKDGILCILSKNSI